MNPADRDNDLMTRLRRYWRPARDGWWNPASVVLGTLAAYLVAAALSWTGWGAFAFIIGGAMLGAVIRVLVIVRRDTPGRRK